MSVWKLYGSLRVRRGWGGEDGRGEGRGDRGLANKGRGSMATGTARRGEGGRGWKGSNVGTACSSMVLVRGDRSASVLPVSISVLDGANLVPLLVVRIVAAWARVGQSFSSESPALDAMPWTEDVGYDAIDVEVRLVLARKEVGVGAGRAEETTAAAKETGRASGGGLVIAGIPR
jgi:hypothetical protein